MKIGGPRGRAARLGSVPGRARAPGTDSTRKREPPSLFASRNENFRWDTVAKPWAAARRLRKRILDIVTVVLNVQ